MGRLLRRDVAEDVVYEGGVVRVKWRIVVAWLHAELGVVHEGRLAAGRTGEEVSVRMVPVGEDAFEVEFVLVMECHDC